MRYATLPALFLTASLLAGTAPGGEPAAPPAGKANPWNASVGGAQAPAPANAPGLSDPIHLQLYSNWNGWIPGAPGQPGAPPAGPPDNGQAGGGPGSRPGRNPGGNPGPWAYGIDVSTRLMTCPDGSQVVAELDAGGWHYVPEQACPESRTGARPGKPQSGGGRPASPGSPAPPRSPAPAPAATPATSPTQAVPPAAPRCDPRTWNCSSGPR